MMNVEENRDTTFLVICTGLPAKFNGKKLISRFADCRVQSFTLTHRTTEHQALVRFKTKEGFEKALAMSDTLSKSCKIVVTAVSKFTCEQADISPINTNKNEFDAEKPDSSGNDATAISHNTKMDDNAIKKQLNRLKAVTASGSSLQEIAKSFEEHYGEHIKYDGYACLEDLLRDNPDLFQYKDGKWHSILQNESSQNALREIVLAQHGKKSKSKSSYQTFNQSFGYSPINMLESFPGNNNGIFYRNPNYMQRSYSPQFFSVPQRSMSTHPENHNQFALANSSISENRARTSMDNFSMERIDLDKQLSTNKCSLNEPKRPLTEVLKCILKAAFPSGRGAMRLEDVNECVRSSEPNLYAQIIEKYSHIRIFLQQRIDKAPGARLFHDCLLLGEHFEDWFTFYQELFNAPILDGQKPMCLNSFVEQAIGTDEISTNDLRLFLSLSCFCKKTGLGRLFTAKPDRILKGKFMICRAADEMGDTAEMFRELTVEKEPPAFPNCAPYKLVCNEKSADNSDTEADDPTETELKRYIFTQKINEMSSVELSQREVLLTGESRDFRFEDFWLMFAEQSEALQDLKSQLSVSFASAEPLTINLLRTNHAVIFHDIEDNDFERGTIINIDRKIKRCVVFLVDKGANVSNVPCEFLRPLSEDLCKPDPFAFRCRLAQGYHPLKAKALARELEEYHRDNARSVVLKIFWPHAKIVDDRRALSIFFKKSSDNEFDLLYDLILKNVISLAE